MGQDGRRLDETRRSWNVATARHNAHKADQAAFLRTGSTLFDDEVALVGDVDGQDLLHVLCNSGQDSLSWAKRGARVTGVDLADVPVAFATGLRDALVAGGVDVDARFVCREAVAYLESCDDRFDVVVGSYGCLPWIADLPRFMRGVRRVLRPGGRACFLEFHPLVWSFDAAFRFARDDYFQTTPFHEAVGDYVGDSEGALAPSGLVPLDAPYENPHVSTSYQQTTAGIVNAVVDAGLALERLHEYPHANGCRVMPGLVRDGQRFVAPPGQLAPPMMLGVRARAI